MENIQFCSVMEELKINDLTIKPSVKTMKIKKLEKSTIDADRFGIVDKFNEIETNKESYLFDLDSLDSNEKNNVVLFLNKELNPSYHYMINDKFGFDVEKTHYNEINVNQRILENGDNIIFVTEIDRNKKEVVCYCKSHNLFYYL